MKFIENFLKKKEVSPDHKEIFTFLDSLKGNDDMDAWIEGIKAIKERYPDFETVLENYKDDEIKNGMYSILAYIRVSEKSEFAHISQNMKACYSPKYSRESRASYRRMMIGMFTIFAGLGTAIGILKYKIDKDFERDEKNAKEWEQAKLSLPFEEIRSQLDTIFQSLNSNTFLFQEYYALRGKGEEYYKQEMKKQAGSHVAQVYSYIDSLEQNSPEELQSLLVEYWKEKQGIPSNYYELAYFPKNLNEPTNDLEQSLRTKEDSLENEKKVFFKELNASYEKVSGETIHWDDAVKEYTKAEQEKIEKAPINNDYRKFVTHIDSLAAPYYVEYSDRIKSGFDQVYETENKVDAETIRVNTLVKEAENAINQEKNQEKRKVLGEQSDALEKVTFEKSNEFNPETWKYLKEYYLNGEVFNPYGNFRDTIAEKEMKELADNGDVQSELQTLADVHTQYTQELQDIERAYNHKIEESKSEIFLTEGGELQKLQAELAELTEEYNAISQMAWQKFLVEYNRIWNEEREKLGVDVEKK
jgi:hypothetical protein